MIIKEATIGCCRVYNLFYLALFALSVNLSQALAAKSIRFDGNFGYSSVSVRTQKSSATAFSGYSAKSSVSYFKSKKYYVGGFAEYRSMQNTYVDDEGGQEFLTNGSLGGILGLFLDKKGSFYLDAEMFFSLLYLDQIFSLTEKHHTYQGIGFRLGSGWRYQGRSFLMQFGPTVEYTALSGGRDTDYGLDVDDLDLQGLSLCLGFGFLI